MNGLERIECKFAVKAADDQGRITGLGAVFGNIDDGFDVIHPGAFTDSLKARTPLMLWQHDATADPVGVWTDVKETDAGLEVSGEMVLVSPQAQQRFALLKAGALNGLSIGFQIDRAEFDRDNVRHIKAVDLWEVSIVNFPMNRAARISAVKRLGGYHQTPTLRQAERRLRDAGWSVAQTKAILAGGYAALKPDRDQAVDDADTRDLIATINAARGCL